jgi:hypothetical protein
MKNHGMTSIVDARKCATLTNFEDKKAVHFAALVLLLFLILPSSGCIGLTSASKVGSNQQGASGAATFSVEPASIKFGSLALGETASQSVTISNNGGSDLTITKASTKAAGVKITGISLPVTIAPGKQSTFNVVFTPKVAGALSGNVSVMTDISSSPSMVTLSGTGMAAAAFLTTNTSSLSFGNVALGRSSTLSVTLTNAGNSTVTVSKVSVSSARYSLSGVSAGLILAPGQSATLDATFTPAGPGNLPANVTVASNAANSPATISLSGDGAQTNSQTVFHSVSLTWIPSTSVVAGYDVYRSEVSGGPYSKLTSTLVAADTYTDPTVQGGLTYYYVVTSVTSAGVQSAYSGENSAAIPTP